MLVLTVVVLRATDPERHGSGADTVVELARHPPVTVVEASLGGLALAVLIRQSLVLVLRRRTRPVNVIGGTSEKEPLPPSGVEPGAARAAAAVAEESSLQTSTALVKATLHELGALPEPTVPLGAIRPTAVSLVDLELPAQANIVAGVLRVALDRLRLQTPYRVTMSLLPRSASGQRDHRLALEILDEETQQLVAHHLVSSCTEREAAIRAACLIYQEVTDRGSTPPWELWSEPGGSTLTSFLAGLEAEKAGRYLDAIRLYGEAAGAEPGNAVIHLRLGNLQEREHLLEQAFETYSEIALTWPELVQARHRLALTLVAMAMDEKVKVTSRTRQLLDLLGVGEDMRARRRRAIQAQAAEPTDDRDALLAAAERQWRMLRAEFRWIRSVRSAVRRAARRDLRTREALPRGPMRRNARVAELGVSLYRLQRALVTGDDDAREAARGRMRTRERQVRGMMSASPPRRLARRFLRTAPDFRAHYNCACIYGVLLQSSDGSPEYVDRAIEQLREVVRAGKTERVYGWALDDPDLAALWALVEEDGWRRDDVHDTQLLALDLLRHQLAAGPTIRRIAPDQGPPGADVRIRGINFHTTPKAEIVVTFGDQRAPVLSVATVGFDTELRVCVPDALSRGAVDVAVALGEHSSVTKPFHVVGPES